MFASIGARLSNLSRPTGCIARYTATARRNARDCIRCRKEIDELAIARLFKDRNIGAAFKGKKCRAHRLAARFIIPIETCKAANTIMKISGIALKQFSDVIVFDPESSTVFLEGINPPPKTGHGDERGDHGLAASKIVKSYVETGDLEVPDTVVDIGCLNRSTLMKIQQALHPHEVKGILVDINRLTPAVSREHSDTKYMIGRMEQILANQEMRATFEGKLPKGGSALFLMNNFLSVIPPEEGLSSFRTIWQCVRPGDSVLVVNLSEKHIDKDIFNRYVDNSTEVDGLVVAKNKDGTPFKTVAKLDPFGNKLATFPNATIVGSGEVEYVADVKGATKTFPVKSIQFLIVKNTKGTE